MILAFLKKKKNKKKLLITSYRATQIERLQQRCNTKGKIIEKVKAFTKASAIELDMDQKTGELET